MITLEDFFQAVNYRITEGSEYGWQCFGPTAYRIESHSDDLEGYAAEVIFDRKNQVVYQAEVHDYKNARSYRITDPDFVAAQTAEAEQRKVDNDQAYDDVKFTDLDVDDDFLEKARAIAAGQDYDTRVSVGLDLDHDSCFELMRQAHLHDLTVNQYVEKILREVLDNTPNK